MYKLDYADCALLLQSEGIENVRMMLKNDVPRHAMIKLKHVIHAFRKGCEDFLRIARTHAIDKGQGAAKTKLDIYRSKTCINYVV